MSPTPQYHLLDVNVTDAPPRRAESEKKGLLVQDVFAAPLEPVVIIP